MDNSLKIVTAEEAVSHVKSGDRVFIQGAAMTPVTLIDALANRYQSLENVEVMHLHTEGRAAYTEEPYYKSFKINSAFVGGNVRKAIQAGRGDYIPIFLSEVHWLFRRNILPLDVAFIQISTPDRHGYCSLGVSVDVSQIDYAIEANEPIHGHDIVVASEIEKQIGAHVAGLVDDGATLQMGIGAIPNAALQNLGNHKNLGIHTEMFSDGILPLVESGVINGSKKEVKTGKLVTCFAVGSQKLYDFMDDNPLVHMKEAAYTNDTAIIRRNPKVTAINSAIEIDLTGQVCADTIGKMQFSGVGGQMDFIRGASLSEGGKAILAMPAATKKGVSKIVPFLQEGAGVTTTRAHVHYVVTEYGVVDLYGKNLKQRAKALISIAHPDAREELEKAAFDRFKAR